MADEPIGHGPKPKYLDGLAWQKGGFPGSILRVLTTWQCPSTGWQLELKRAELQPADESTLVLELVAREPQVGGNALVDHLVEYMEEADTHYETVRFFSTSESLSVAHLWEG